MVNATKTPVSDFDFNLPQDRIAQHPAHPRESARLMTLNRTTGVVSHLLVSDLPSLFVPGDTLVINNTRVFKARLRGVVGPNAAKAELFLVRPEGNGIWKAIGKPGPKLIPGAEIRIAGDFSAVVVERMADGTFTVRFGGTPDDVIAQTERYGEVPVPPYIKTIPDAAEYQTSYARVTGSVAAPTAGFHLTPAIRSALQAKGVDILEVTLHVGLGTFMPIKTDSIQDHAMHAEWAHVPSAVAEAVMRAKHDGRRVIAVGTTSVRTLEGVAALHNGSVVPFSGDLNLYITPGFRFSVVDAMLTNFHLPKSTLIVLVSSFAGREYVMNAYNEAVSMGYRFFSFGDAMFVS